MTTYRVTFLTEDGNVETRVGEREYLLDAAARAGLPVPQMCLQGWCLSCAGRVIEGEVAQDEAFRIFPEDEEAGYVLMCSAYARSDLVIRTHQEKAMKAFRRRHGRPAPGG